jgi:hypothetical protein
LSALRTSAVGASLNLKEQQFRIFPRARTYKIWVQFQRKSVGNTASFTVPAPELK